MAQNRDAPAFQEYPAAMMARIPFRTMSLAGRGLLYTLRLECWVNRSVPANPRTLARVLGYAPEDIEDILPEVLPFFAVTDDMLSSPELDDYRAHLETVREKQSQGGKQGAARTNAKRQSVATETPAGDLPGDSQVTRVSLVQPSKAQHSPVKQSPDVLMTGALTEWTNEYDRHSNGG